MRQAPARGLKVIYGYNVWQSVFRRRCHQFDLKTKLLKDGSILKCISHSHSLHELISGSIVRMSMFCILWMLCCFACQLPGSDNVPFVCCWATAFSLRHFKGGFCRLFLNVKRKQTLSSSLFTRSIISLSPFKWPLLGVFIEHISHEILVDLILLAIDHWDQTKDLCFLYALSPIFLKYWVSQKTKNGFPLAQKSLYFIKET